MHTYMHTYIHTYMHTYIHTYIHIAIMLLYVVATCCDHTYVFFVYAIHLTYVTGYAKTIPIRTRTEIQFNE